MQDRGVAAVLASLLALVIVLLLLEPIVPLVELMVLSILPIKHGLHMSVVLSILIDMPLYSLYRLLLLGLHDQLLVVVLYHISNKTCCL